MKEFNYIPIYRIGINEISQGIEVKACDFCCKNCSTNPKCQEFYEQLYGRKDGEYICPYGFVASVFSDELEERYIFTGLRLKGKYDAKKCDPKIKLMEDGNIKCRRITQGELDKYKEYYLEYKDKTESYLNLKMFIEDILHDMRKFNGQIKAKSERLCNDSKSSKKLKKFHDQVQNIRAICAFMTLRLNAYDFIYNEVPMDATSGTSYNMFRVFDKVRHCLKERAASKNISIEIESKGECGDILGYDCIELLPYILLDNAIKYGESKSSIRVFIDDNMYRCKISVDSKSLKLKDGECDKIFVRGYRGENAKDFTNDGLGIGLYTAKKICELHKGVIEVHENEDNNGKNHFIIDITLNK